MFRSHKKILLVLQSRFLCHLNFIAIQGEELKFVKFHKWRGSVIAAISLVSLKHELVNDLDIHNRGGDKIP